MKSFLIGMTVKELAEMVLDRKWTIEIRVDAAEALARAVIEAAKS